MRYRITILITFFLNSFLSLGSNILDIPANDNPCITGENSSHLLVLGETFIGSTCGARGIDEYNADGTPADLRPRKCFDSGQSQDVVWHHYFPLNEDGFDIAFEGDNMTIEVYWAPQNLGCVEEENAYERRVVAHSCSGSLVASLSNCTFNEDDIIHVRIASSEINCGEYSLMFNSNSCMDGGKICEEAFELDDIITKECGDESGSVSTDACLTYSCRDSKYKAACNEFAQYPTVWFKTRVDELAHTVQATVTPNSDWIPTFSIFQGMNCDSIIPLYNESGYSCSDGNGDPFNYHGAIRYPSDGSPFEGEDIYIAVTHMYSDTIDKADLGFNIKVDVNQDCLDCVDDDIGHCIEDAIDISVEQRSSNRALDDKEFCPGEEVSLCMEFTYLPSQSHFDWLQAIMPRFGSGWDMEFFDPSSAQLNTNYGIEGLSWIDTDDIECGARARIRFPLVNLYYDENDNLTFCHKECEDCPENAVPLNANDKLPSGWYFLTPTAICETTCSPRNNWGLNSAFDTTNVEICMNLRVKNSLDDCYSPRNLSIDILPASDALTGCWDSAIPCVKDDILLGPDDWSISCGDQPYYSTVDTSVCSGSELAITISDLYAINQDIELYVLSNSNVEGEGTVISNNPLEPTMISDSTIVLNEVLYNTTDTIQEVIYRARYVVDTMSECSNAYQNIRVKVYPQINISFEEVEVCERDAIELIPMVTGGTGRYEYQWSNGSTDSIIVVSALADTIYTLTTTDGVGCRAMQEANYSIAEIPELGLPESITICEDNAVVLSSPVGMTFYQWKDLTMDEVISTDPMITLNGPGLVELTVYNNECLKRDTVEIVASDNIDLGTTEIIFCDMIDSPLVLTGYQGYEWTDEMGNVLGTGDAYTPTGVGLYRVTFVSEAGCTGVARYDVELNESPELILGQMITVCNAEEGESPYTVDLASLVDGISGSWSISEDLPEGFEITDATNVSFVGVPSGSYTFSYTTSTAMFPCEDAMDSITIMVLECGCPEISIGELSDVCNDGGELDLGGLSPQEEMGYYSMQDEDGNMVTIIDDKLSLGGLSAGIYEVSFTLEEIKSGCTSSVSTSLRVHDYASVEYVSSVTACGEVTEDDRHIINLNELIEGDRLGVWYDVSGILVEDVTNVSFEGSAIGDEYNYYYLIENEEPCVDFRADVTVSVIDCMTATEETKQELLTVYPVPAGERVYIRIGLNSTYKIYGIEGNLIKKGKYLKDGIDVQDLSQGVYMIRMMYRNTQYWGRIVKI